MQRWFRRCINAFARQGWLNQPDLRAGLLQINRLAWNERFGPDSVLQEYLFRFAVLLVCHGEPGSWNNLVSGTITATMLARLTMLRQYLNNRFFEGEDLYRVIMATLTGRSHHHWYNQLSIPERTFFHAIVAEEDYGIDL